MAVSTPSAHACAGSCVTESRATSSAPSCLSVDTAVWASVANPVLPVASASLNTTKSFSALEKKLRKTHCKTFYLA